MSILSQAFELLRYPLFTLSGQEITAFALLTSVLIVVVARVLAGLLGRGLFALLGRRGVDDGARFALRKITHYVVMIIGVMVAAASIGLKLDAVLAASAVLLVGIGFGLQSIAQNFISGVILLLERPVGKGDFVRIGDSHGSVVDIGLRATRIETRDQVTIIVPNSELISGQVVNYSSPTHSVRVKVSVGVAYGTDTALVDRLLREVAAAEELVLDEPGPDVRFEDFGASSLDFSVLVWIARPKDDQLVASRLRFAIDAAFRREGVKIPFPQRDLHIVSGLAPATRDRQATPS